MTPRTPLLPAVTVQPVVAGRRSARVVAVLLGLLGGLLAGPLATEAARAADASPVPTTVRGWSTSTWSVPQGRVAQVAVRVRTGDRWAARRTVLQFRPTGGSWTRVDAERTQRDGRVVLGWTVRGSGVLRVRVAATRTARAVTTRGRRVEATGARASSTGLDGRADRFESAVFRLVNELRAQGTRCGSAWMPPVRPVVRHARLDEAASAYAARLAREDFFSHVDPQGRDAGDRAEAAGYRWSRVGENLAAGQDTPGDVVQAWRGSPGHCRVMMGEWVHLGLGFAHDEASTYGEHWVQVFGVPQR